MNKPFLPYRERHGADPISIPRVSMPVDVTDAEAFPEIARAQRDTFPLRHHFASDQLEQIGGKR